MEWTRSPLMRVLAFAAGVALVLLNRDERGGFFWLGIAVIVLNGIGLAALGLARDRQSRTVEAGRELDEPVEVDVTISELRHLPEVAQALAAAPAQWRQVTYFDHHFDATDLAWLSEYAWVTTEDGDWTLGLGDEVKPFVDLDVDEADDPALAVLAADPRVLRARHEEREVYRVETREAMTSGEFAALAIRALVAHHRQASERLG